MLNVERDYLLEDLGFDIHDSAIQEDIFPRPELEDAGVPFTRFLEEARAAKMAVLLWVGHDNVERLRQAEEWAARNDYTYRLNEADTAALQNLTRRDVLVVTEPALMRGFDYRCSTGIALLVARAFDGQRAYFQALGRVGRYGEPCRRIKDAALGKLYEDDVQAVTAKLDELKERAKRYMVAGSGQTSLSTFMNSTAASKLPGTRQAALLHYA